MENSEIINKVVKFTENIVNSGDFDETEISKILNLSYRSDRNLNIYRGIILVYYFYKFKKLPQNYFKNLAMDARFLKCVALLNGNVLLPFEIKILFLNILTISDNEAEYRDILLGSFYGSLWSFMNDFRNFEIAVDYGIEIIKSAFILDKFNIKKKLKLKEKEAKIISLAGSGKKEIKLLNISSMAAIITAAVGRKINENIIVEKTISRTTSSVTGSSDIFEFLGINLNMPIDEMARISSKAKLGVFDIDGIVPKLNNIYDGRLYNVQVFAGLVGGAAIVNPIDTSLINYGLTRGSTKLCLAILSKLYPNKNIVIFQGKDSTGKPVIDQFSTVSNTEIAQRINGKDIFYTITPKEFGFDFKSLKYIETAKSSKENMKEFIKLLVGRGHKSFEQVVAMEVSLNLYGLGIINDLKIGANIALDVIHSGGGIKIIKDLVSFSKGNMQKFDSLLNTYLN